MSLPMGWAVSLMHGEKVCGWEADGGLLVEFLGLFITAAAVSLGGTILVRHAQPDYAVPFLSDAVGQTKALTSCARTARKQLPGHAISLCIAAGGIYAPLIK